MAASMRTRVENSRRCEQIIFPTTGTTSATSFIPIHNSSNSLPWITGKIMWHIFCFFHVWMYNIIVTGVITSPGRRKWLWYQMTRRWRCHSLDSETELKFTSVQSIKSVEWNFIWTECYTYTCKVYQIVKSIVHYFHLWNFLLDVHIQRKYLEADKEKHDGRIKWITLVEKVRTVDTPCILFIYWRRKFLLHYERRANSIRSEEYECNIYVSLWHWRSERLTLDLQPTISWDKQEQITCRAKRATWCQNSIVCGLTNDKQVPRDTFGQ